LDREGGNGRISRGEEGWELELVSREREKERKEGRIRMEKAKYNSRYRELLVEEGVPKYLERENLVKTELGEGIKALTRLRCDNLKEWNKYWLDENKRLCSFCGRGKDNLEHFVRDCEET